MSEDKQYVVVSNGHYYINDYDDLLVVDDSVQVDDKLNFKHGSKVREGTLLFIVDNEEDSIREITRLKKQKKQLRRASSLKAGDAKVPRKAATTQRTLMQELVKKNARRKPQKPKGLKDCEKKASVDQNGEESNEESTDDTRKAKLGPRLF